MKLKHITIGADPEMFLYDRITDKFKSAIGIIPGHKETPFHPEDLSQGFMLQTDNVLIEFNIPPVKFEDEHTFIAHLLNMRKYIDDYLQKQNTAFVTKCQASANLSEDELTDPQAREFGCDPDYNCYTSRPNRRPVMHDPTLRSAGFHWHVGFDTADVASCVKLIQYMDTYMGIPSILLDHDTKRRSLYGKAGAFRLQPYGVEWRVLSSYFLNGPDLIALMYRQLERAIKAFEDNVQLPEPFTVISTINRSDTNKAKELIDKFKLTNLL